MVGSWNYADPYFGQVNMRPRAVQLNMGSTTKLFTYTTAIASTKFTMTTPILDDYYTFPIPGSAPYKPFDDDRRTPRRVRAQGLSRKLVQHPGGQDRVRNRHAVHRQHRAGHGRAVARARTAATMTRVVNWPGPYAWAATLGSLTCGITLLDLADGAATLGDLGVQHNPMPVTKIVAEQTGQTVWTYNPTAAGHQVIPANVAYIMDEITSNDNNRIREFGRDGSADPESAPGERQDRYRRVLPRQPHGRLDPEPAHRGLGGERQRELPAAQGRQVHGGAARKEHHYSTMTRLPASRIRSVLDDLAQYGLKPAHPALQTAATSTASSPDTAARPRSGTRTCRRRSRACRTPGTRRQPDVITVSTGQGFDDSNFYLPGTGPDAPAGQCTYYGPTPLPDKTCTYARTGGSCASADHHPEPKPVAQPRRQTHASAFPDAADIAPSHVT